MPRPCSASDAHSSCLGQSQSQNAWVWIQPCHLHSCTGPRLLFLSLHWGHFSFSPRLVIKPRALCMLWVPQPWSYLHRFVFTRKGVSSSKGLFREWSVLDITTVWLELVCAGRDVWIRIRQAGHSLLVCFGLACLFLEAGCPRTHCVFKTGLKFLTLPPPLQCWNERPANLA